MSKFDETCSMCGSQIVASVFQDGTLCQECRSNKRTDDARPMQMPSAVSEVAYEQLPDGFRLVAKARSGRYLVGLGALALFWGVVLKSAKTDPWTLLFMGLASMMAFLQSLMGLFGVVRLVRNGPQLSVFTGVGPIGVRNDYDWADFTFVHERSAGEGNEHEVVLAGGRRVSFGRQLSDEQRYFLREVLRIELSRSGLK